MTALIVVDMQNDFANPQGSLYVDGGVDIIKPIQKFVYSEEIWDLVVFTQDWHPYNHVSFKIYPPHCIQNSKGADIVQQLQVFNNIVQLQLKKGYDLSVDSLSAFANENGVETGLDQILKSRGIKDVVIVGLALDLCVFYTAMDALKSYNVFVVKPLTRPIDKVKGLTALEKLVDKGVIIIQ